MEQCIQSIENKFYLFSRRYIFYDDFSDEKNLRDATGIKKYYKNVEIVFGKSHKGIIHGLNVLIKNILPSDLVAIPISSDSRMISRLYPPFLYFLVSRMKYDFVFTKTLHWNDCRKKKVGITGWADKKGHQEKKLKMNNFISGKTRPSGWSVAFKAQTLKKYSYPSLGPLSDFYINNFMILNHKSFYWPLISTMTLQRSKSFSSTFSEKQCKKLLVACFKKLNKNSLKNAGKKIEMLLKSENLHVANLK